MITGSVGGVDDDNVGGDGRRRVHTTWRRGDSLCFLLRERGPARATQGYSSAASDVCKRQVQGFSFFLAQS